ncbi:MAG TPA: M61 family peptidase [Candidatus Angelobacter sp.]|nr:M61 family peptidase [Candidatus Angelobacter sp.]
MILRYRFFICAVLSFVLLNPAWLLSQQDSHSSARTTGKKNIKRPAEARSTASAGPIKLVVDATHATEKVLHARMDIPVTPGPVRLVYPEWIPGEHGPTGPIVDFTGLEFFAGGKRLTWRRDLVDMYSFHVNVPEGVGTLEARADLVMPAPPEGFSSGASSTTQLDLLSWNQLVLYPYTPSTNTDDIQVTASVKLPAGWHYGTALQVAGESGNEIAFQPVSLTMLIDSPVIAGAHFRRIALTPEGPIQHYIDIAADSEAALQMPQETIDHYKRLVAETGALYGARHYREYHFLLTLSDHTAHFGLEHHQSSDDRVAERTMIDDDMRWLAASLLPHEMTHSWNGKYRRPEGLATPNYQDPMKGDLLWVYEGLTQYFGEILAARSGLWTPDQFLQEAAETAAALNNTPGRSWRPLQDTADAAQILYGAPQEFESWRRSTDYYPEGFLIWLDADTVIRQQSHGQKSMNDFARAFYGGPNTPPIVVKYNFDDVVKTLNSVVPYDWAKFLRDRLDTYGPDAPLGGFTNGGWKLVYTEEPSQFTRDMEKTRDVVDARFSIGLTLDDKGGIHDVLWGSPAAQAGIAPGTILAAVNGRKYSPDVLRDALRGGKDGRSPLELLVISGDFYKTYSLNYHGGEKYAHLVRDESKPDVLGDIIKPLAK